jgi:biotin carboxyl carrier protein
MPKYIATLNGTSHELTVEENGAGALRVSLAGQSFAVDTQGATLLIDGRPARARVHEQSGHLHVELDGRSFAIELEDARFAGGAGAKKKQSGRASLKAPMPGKLARLLVKEGDTVKERQGLAVIEAMKMENELKSPIAGVVTKLIAASRVGSNVDGGEEIAIIEAKS